MGFANEFLSASHRHFPNIITVTLLFAGLFLGKANWVLVGTGAIAVAIVVLILQYALFNGAGLGVFPGAEVFAACSMIPSGSGQYLTAPSLWIALTLFYMTYIIKNAANVYTTTPTKLPAAAIPVQQRKGLGLISIIACVLLLITLMVSRFMTGCETGSTLWSSIIGISIAVATGIVAGNYWWVLLNACGADYYPDIHGVMIGLRPGGLHTSPVACTPR